MDPVDKKNKVSFRDIERILDRYKAYLAEHDEMIRVLEHMQRDLQATVNEIDHLLRGGEVRPYYRVSGMPRLKVRNVLPHLQQEKLKKERLIENFRKKIVQQNEELIEFQKKHLKIPDPRDMPSTSYDERFL